MSNLSILQGNTTASSDLARNGKKVIPIFFPEGGFIPSSHPSRIYSCFRISRLTEVGDVGFEFDNERDLFEVGKTKVTVNDGTITSFELTNQGNAYTNLALLFNQDALASPVISMGQTKALAGHLALYGAGSGSNDALVCDFFPNVQIKQTSAPGATDGESTFTIEVKTTSTAYHGIQYAMAVKEIFYDNGSTITNADAPDGTLTDFKLGEGNGTNISTAGPLALAFNPSATGLSQYIYEVKVDGSTVSSGVTYNSTTGVLTWGSAPADGAKIEVTYFVRSGAPVWDATKQYGVGHIVYYGSSYYTASAVSAPGTLPDAGAPWSAYTGFGYDGSSGIATPVIPHSRAQTGDVSLFLHIDDIVA